MLTGMRCIGVFLDSPGIISTTRTRCLITSLGLVVFLFNVQLNGSFVSGIIVYLNLVGIEGDERGFAMKWNDIIGIFNQIIMMVFSQMFLMSAAVSKWPSLVQVLSEIENDNFFEKKDYHRFRHFFVLGLVWLISVSWLAKKCCCRVCTYFFATNVCG